MSQENVEIVRRGIDAFNRRDQEAMLEQISPAIEFRSYLIGALEAEVLQGHAGARRWWDRIMEAFPDLRYEVLDERARGDKVMVKFMNRASGATSGAPVDLILWTVFTVRGGKVTHWFTFRTENEALEAAGLSE